MGDLLCNTSHLFLLCPVAVAAARPLKVHSSVSGSSQQIQGTQENVLAPAAYNMYSNTQLFGRTSQQSLEQDMVAGKRGSFLQSVPPSERQENGAFYVIQAGAGFGKTATCIRRQPTLKLKQQEISSRGPTQNSSLQVSTQSVNQVPVTIPVQYQTSSKDGNALLGIPSEQNLPTSVQPGKEHT